PRQLAARALPLFGLEVSSTPPSQTVSTVELAAFRRRLDYTSFTGYSHRTRKMAEEVHDDVPAFTPCHCSRSRLSPRRAARCCGRTRADEDESRRPQGH